MEREALKLALEALEGLFGTTEQFEGGNVAVWRLGGSAQPKQAIIAIKETLAQPEQDGKCKYCVEGCIACDARAQPAQEPVAWVNTGELQGLTLGHYSHVVIYTDESTGRTPLYTTPPQRPWVGLTAEETSGFTQHEMTVVKYVSKVLQEKNNGT